MKLSSIVRIVWLLSFALFVGVGVGLVWWPSAQTIESLKLEASHYYDEANTNEADVRQASQVEAVQERLQSDLQSLTPSSTRGGATAVLLQLLADESKAFHVSVRSIVPGNTLAPAAGAFDTTDVELTLSGRFVDVLRFVADLPKHESLIDVRDMTLADADPRAASPVLTVTLTTTLYRFRGRTREGDTHASSSV